MKKIENPQPDESRGQQDKTIGRFEIRATITRDRTDVSSFKDLIMRCMVNAYSAMSYFIATFLWLLSKVDEKRNMTFDTGSYPATGKSVLTSAIHDLRRKYKGEVKKIKTWIDDVGVFAHLIKIPEPYRENYSTELILIAKGSRLYKGIISTQIEILWHAEHKQVPILLAWKSPNASRIRYYLFDAEWALKESKRNLRYGEEMANYPFNLGEEWNIDEEKLQTALERLETRKKIAKEQAEKRKKKWTLDDFFKP